VNRLGRFLPQRTQDAIHLWRVKTRDDVLFGREWDIRRAMPERFVRAVFQIMLRRDPDPAAIENYVTKLGDRRITPDEMLDEVLSSMEMRELPYTDILRSLHQSRCDFVRMLPRARLVLDLGGTDQAEDAGALVSMGYPYRFDLLTIVDLPGDARHEIYGARTGIDTVGSRCGPVQYRYHSMVDLSAYPDASFDLVFSGQTIEHITEDEARKMLAEVRRVLVPGGWFALDTPNRRITELQYGPETLSNPDHELEYSHVHLSALLEEAGFTITGVHGLSYAGECLADGHFDEHVVAARHGVYHEIEDCYLLAYICTKRD
jgi:SAM-dependent methyltransferase